MNILLVDDHAVVRKGLIQILEEDESLEAVFFEAGNFQDALTVINSEQIELVLLDITLPGKSGLELLQQIRRDGNKVPILIVSMYPEEQYAVRTLKLGADGYLSKDSAPEELLNAVSQIRKSGKYISAILSSMLASEVAAGRSLEKLPHQTLSNREIQIACLLASGKSSREVANELCLSVKTVGSYRTRLMHKLGVRNNAELTKYCISNSLLI